MMIEPRRYRWIAMAALLPLAACANLSDVQNFAKASSDVIASEPIIASWPTAYATARRREARLERLTTLCKLPADTDQRAVILSQMDKARHDTEIAAKAAAVLALYMDTLGQLAGNDVADTSAQRSALQTSIAGIPDVTSTEKAAAGALLAVLDAALDGWRRHKIDGLVKQADPSVQILTAYLARVTKAVAAAEGAGARLGDAYWERSGCNADEGTKSLLYEREAAEDDAIAALQTRADAAAKVYAKIGAGHAAMAANSGKLTGKALKAILKRDLPTLNSAAKAFEGSD